MPTPLSGLTYGSRFNDDENIFSYNDVFEYKNMTYHGFYGAGSIQAQELNELQEQCQTQSSVYCNLLENWLIYNNIDGKYTLATGISGGFLTIEDTIIPEDPNYITTLVNGLNVNYLYTKGWYFKQYSNGFGQYVYLPHLNTVSLGFGGSKDYLLRYLIQKRTANSRGSSSWSFLKDQFNPTTLDEFGSHRIQDYLLTNKNASDPIGACCVENVCSTTTAFQCAILGGDWKIGIPCGSDTCSGGGGSPFGACCVSGVCSLVTQVDCAILGGVWIDEGIQCESDTCSDGNPTEQTGTLSSGGPSIFNNVLFYTTGFTGEVKSISGWDPDATASGANFIGKAIRNVNGFNLTPPPGLTGVLQIEQGLGFAVALIDKNGTRSLTAWGHPVSINGNPVAISQYNNSTTLFMQQLNHYQQSNKRLNGIGIKKIATTASSIFVLLDNGEVTSYAQTTNVAPEANEENYIWAPIGKIPIPVKNNATYITGWTGYVSQIQGASLSSYIVSTNPSNGCFGPNNAELGPTQLDGITWHANLSWRQYRKRSPNCGRGTPGVEESPLGWTLTGAPNDYYFSRESVGQSGPNYSTLSTWHPEQNERILMSGMTGYVNPSNFPKDIRSNFPSNSVFGISNKKYIDIAGGRSHVIVLTEEGTIETWGWNYYYTITGSGSHSQGSAGFIREGSGFTLGRDDNAWDTTDEDGILHHRPWPQAPMGDNTAPIVKLLKNTPKSVIGIGSSYYNSAVIFDDITLNGTAKQKGSIFVWDRNEWGESLPTGNLPNGPFKQISGGYHHFIGLRDDGTVACWGENNDGECDVPPALTTPNSGNPCVKVCALKRISFALQKNGDLWGWGNTTERAFGFKGFTSGERFNVHPDINDQIIIPESDIPDLPNTNQLKDWCDIVANRMTTVDPGDLTRNIDLINSYSVGVTWTDVAGEVGFKSFTNFGQPLLREWSVFGGGTALRYSPDTYIRKFSKSELDQQKFVFPEWMTDNTIADTLFTQGCTAQAIQNIRAERDVMQGYWHQTHLPQLVVSLYSTEINAQQRAQLINKINDIFNEISKYTDKKDGNIKFQRKGWTLITRGSPSGLCEDSEIDDGAYLASGWITQPICFALHIIEKIPDDLKPGINQTVINKLKTTLKHEMFNLILNWKELIAWYTRGTITGGPVVGQPNTNQWMEPNISLITIPMVLENSDYLDVYNLGIVLFLSCKIACRDDGSFAEGYSYSEQTGKSIVKCLLMINNISNTDRTIQEDRHLNFKDWIKSYWNWILDHHLPGNHISNYNDSVGNRVLDIDDYSETLAYAAITYHKYFKNDTALTGLEAIQNLKVHYPNSSANAGTLQAIILKQLQFNPIPNYSIKNHNHYNHSRLVVWRQGRKSPSFINNSNTNTSSNDKHFCIWLKGSASTEGHRHSDEGQFSIYCGNRIVILESGANYNISEARQSKLRGESGHNIFQLFKKSDPNVEPRSDCPITVRELGLTGGDVSISLNTAYDGNQIAGITRDIIWNLVGNNFATSNEFISTIRDNILFTQNKNTNDSILFKYHTGSTASSPPAITQISGNPRNWMVQWPGTTFGITSNIDITVQGGTAENATLIPTTTSTDNISVHHVINIKSTESQPTLRLSTTVNIHTRKLPSDKA